MKKLLCALVLAASVGCTSLPVDDVREAKSLKIARTDSISFSRKKCTINVVFNKKYEPISRETKAKDIETILNTLKYAIDRHSVDFTDKEDLFTDYFTLLRRITKSDPEIEFDIIPNSGLNYLLLKLGNWDGIYYAPTVIIKQKSLNPFTIAHEFCHATDKHYSKFDYLFSRAPRYRMEAVAIAGEQHIADYFSSVYGMNDLANTLWEKASLHRISLETIHEKNKTFEEAFHNESKTNVAKLMTHILLDKFRGDIEKTYFFLRDHDCEAVYEEIYGHLRNKNYHTAALNAVSDQQTRLDWRTYDHLMKKKQ